MNINTPASDGLDDYEEIQKKNLTSLTEIAEGMIAQQDPEYRSVKAMSVHSTKTISTIRSFKSTSTNLDVAYQNATQAAAESNRRVDAVRSAMTKKVRS